MTEARRVRYAALQSRLQARRRWRMGTTDTPWLVGQGRVWRTPVQAATPPRSVRSEDWAVAASGVTCLVAVAVSLVGFFLVLSASLPAPMVRQSPLPLAQDCPDASGRHIAYDATTHVLRCAPVETSDGLVATGTGTITAEKMPSIRFERVEVKGAEGLALSIPDTHAAVTTTACSVTLPPMGVPLQPGATMTLHLSSLMCVAKDGLWCCHKLTGE
jgi:hypothetical protein